MLSMQVIRMKDIVTQKKHLPTFKGARKYGIHIQHQHQKKTKHLLTLKTNKGGINEKSSLKPKTNPCWVIFLKIKLCQNV